MKTTFFSVFEKIQQIIGQLITIIIALAIVGFLWGIVKILFSSDNTVAKKEGRNFMLYGILIIFVMTSMWGLVKLLEKTIIPDGSKDLSYTTFTLDNNFLNIL